MSASSPPVDAVASSAIAGATTVSAAQLSNLVHGWAVAGPEEQPAALQELLAAASPSGDNLRALPAAVLQQLITLLLQASLNSAGNQAPLSATATQAHAQRVLLDRLWRVLTSGRALTPDASSIALLGAVVRAHTLQPGVDKDSLARSRRNSLQQAAIAALAAGAADTPATATSAATAAPSAVDSASTVTPAPPPRAVRSRRGSLSAQPLEEEAVASLRHQAFKLAFEFVAAQGNAVAALGSTSPLFATEASCRAVASLYVLGVSDVWSPVRKTAAAALARGPLVPALAEHNLLLLQELFESLLALALGGVAPTAGGTATAADVDVRQSAASSWQVQEGAVMAIASLLMALQRHSASKVQTTEERIVPSFLVAAPPRFYPLLAHAQLTVREQTCAVLRGFVELLPPAQSVQLKHELQRSLISKLACAPLPPSDSAPVAAVTVPAAGAEQSEESATPLLSDYESEGLLTVLHSLQLLDASSLKDDHLAVLDRYLGHPASSVRQLVAEMMARIAAVAATVNGAVTTAAGVAPPSFDLLAFLAQPEWSWSESEASAAALARESPLPAEVHTTAMFFVLPPPGIISSAHHANQSRRGSFSATAASAPVPIAASSSPSPSPSSPNATTSTPHRRRCPAHRRSWQWKEGALMCLELRLRNQAAQLRSNTDIRGQPSSHSPVLSSQAASLALLFPQVVRAASSWSWELRRMAEQIRSPFLAVWLHGQQGGEGATAAESCTAGMDVLRMCAHWLQVDHQHAAGGVPAPSTLAAAGGADGSSPHPTAASLPAAGTVHTPQPPAVHSLPHHASGNGGGVHAVPLASAVDAVIALTYVMSYMQRLQQLQAACQDQLSSSSAVAAEVADDEDVTERKWQQEYDDLPVDASVQSDLARGLPAVLTRLEHLVVTVQLSEHHHAALLSAHHGEGGGAAAAANAATPPSLVSWEQFTSLAIKVIVLAYALDFPSSVPSSSSSSTSTSVHGIPAAATAASLGLATRQRRCSLHVSEQQQLQHYQCVLDRLRSIRSLCLGEDIPLAVSVAAVMPAATVSPPAPSASAAVTVGSHPLPAIAAVHILPPSSTSPPPPLSGMPSKLAALQRARAKRLELWLLTHTVGPSLAAFTSNVPREALVDLLALLHDYLSRYCTAPAASAPSSLPSGASPELRGNLLRAVAAGWMRIGQVQPFAHAPHLWSHQLHQLQERSLATLLSLLSEPHHLSERTLVVAALTALVTASAPMLLTQLKDVLQTVADLVVDGYETISLDSPPPPPSTLLSPTSAARAAEVEAWDDWDEEEDDSSTTAAAATTAAAEEPQAVYERFMHARQLVIDVAPLLLLLHAQPFAAVLPSISSTSSVHSHGQLPVNHPHPDAHSQSSLATLVAAYEAESVLAKPNMLRQVQLLQLIQQWASQVQQRVEGHATAASSAATSSPSLSSSLAVRLSSHQCMPLNAPMRDTVASLSSKAQAKIAWLQEQGEAQGHQQGEREHGASNTALAPHA